MARILTISSLKKKAWRYFSEYIRRRAVSHTGLVSCYTCGKTINWKSAHAGHFLAKNLGQALLFHEDNVRVQCPRCNLYLHGNQAEFMKRLLKEIGEDRVYALFELKRNTKQFTKKELEQIVETYKQKLETL